MVRGCDHDALSTSALKEEQERTENSARLTNIVTGTVTAQSVELVEQVDRTATRGGIKENSKLATGLSKVLAHQRVQPDRQQRQFEIVREDCCCHCLACAGRPLQEQPMDWAQPTLHEHVSLPLFADYLLDLLTKFWSHNEIWQRYLRMRSND